MIDGLRLTFTGEELRQRLQERVEDHERSPAWYRKEATREPDPKDAYDFCLPEHQCEYGEQLHGWRAAVLDYIREHIEGGEVYRLGPADLEFGEILPEAPPLVKHAQADDQSRIGFSLERIAKKFDRSGFGPAEIAEALKASRQAAGRAPRKPRERKAARVGK